MLDFQKRSLDSECSWRCDSNKELASLWKLYKSLVSILKGFLAVGTTPDRVILIAVVFQIRPIMFASC